MRIVSWNMNHCKRKPDAHASAWKYLRETLKADIALVQEAVPPADPRSVYRPIHESNPRYRWGSAVVALSANVHLQERTRVALASWDWRERPADALPDSHPGASAVADVLDADKRFLFTAVSLYGQWEMMGGDKTYHSSARVHRILSDLTAVLARARSAPVVIAGDFNLSTQGGKTVDARDAAAAFARISAWGLAECIAHTRGSRPTLAGCKCSDRENCAHVQTYRHGNKPESWPTQFDYAFVSNSALPRLRSCVVIHDEEAWALSDHCPIVLEIT